MNPDEDEPGEDEDELVHVLVERRVRSHDWVRPHFTRRLDRHDRDCRDGLPLTTVARTLLDLAGVGEPDLLRRALKEAYVQRQVNEPMLREQLARSPGHHGAPHLAALLTDPAPTRSELEDRLLALIRAADLGAPAVNARVRAGGRWYEVDFLFAREKVIVEADGARFHDNPVAWRADGDKQAALEALGYYVVRVTWHQATVQAEETVRRLRVVLGGADVPAPPSVGPSRPRDRLG